MNVQSLNIRNFRNHADSVLEFGGGVNVLWGKNGQGKTNILEAISCLGLTRSFYAANDTTLVQFGHDSFLAEGTFVSDAGIESHVRLAFVKDPADKVYTANGERFTRLASVIGMFPLVVLSPENGAITLGGPADRRKFIDMVLCQLSRSYFDDLLEYRHTLRQRNKILSDGRMQGGLREDSLEPWNDSLASYGARIVHKRTQFVSEFRQHMVCSYADMVERPELPSMGYITTIEGTSEQNVEAIAENMRRQLAKVFPEECRRGITLVGPHRDDLQFQLDGTDLQRYASQGQHKTFLVALKIAEFSYLKERMDEAPILLLDDVLSELDGTRSKRLLSNVAELGQTIITTTDDSPFNGIIEWGDKHRKLYVEQGTCKPITSGSVKEATVGV